MNPYLFHILKNKPIVNPINDLKNRICMVYDIAFRDLKSKDVNRFKAEARHVFFFVIKKTTNMSLEQIGKILNRDHSSVIYGIKKVNNYLDINDKDFNKRFMRILTYDEIEAINDSRIYKLIKH